MHNFHYPIRRSGRSLIKPLSPFSLVLITSCSPLVGKWSHLVLHGKTNKSIFLRFYRAKLLFCFQFYIHLKSFHGKMLQRYDVLLSLQQGPDVSLFSEVILCGIHSLINNLPVRTVMDCIWVMVKVQDTDDQHIWKQQISLSALWEAHSVLKPFLKS